MKRLIRDFLIPWLAAMGIPGLLRALRRWLQRKPTRVMILLYHRICDPQTESFRFQSETLGVAPDRFAGQVAYLAQHYSIRSLPRGLKSLHSPGARPEPVERDEIVITFDDGYRDNLTQALPILQRHDAPATIFLATDFIGETLKWMWNDRLAPLLEGLDEDRWSERIGTFPYPALGERLGRYRHLSGAEKRVEINLLAEELKKIPNQSRESVLELLTSNQRPNSTRAQADERLMLSWSEVAQMAESGITFGAHTCSHPILTQVSREQAEREILESGRIVAEKLGSSGGNSDSFAFPNGRPGDIPPESERILATGGYRSALTTVPGINYPGGDPYSLYRISVSNLTAAQFAFLVEFWFWRA